MPKSIGEILKSTRLDRNLSLDEAAENTRIRYKYLEALENDNFDLLPSSVQGRGFLRSYAEYLELDAGSLLRAWETRSLVVLDAESDEAAAPLEETLPDPVTAEPEPAGEPSAKPDIITKEAAPPAETATPRKPAVPVDFSDLSAKSAARFHAVSSALRNQRETLGLSLSDIEQYTHIRQFYLQAIEKGRFEDLPSPVQAKGMIEIYAQFLDINSDELLLEYAEGLQAQREEKLALSAPSKASKPASKPAKQGLTGKLLSPDLVIGVFVIILLVGFAVWTTGRVISNRNQQAEATIPGISEMLVSTGSATAETGIATPGAPAAAATLDLSAPDIQESAPAAEESAVSSTGQAEGTPDASGGESSSGGPLQINIVTNQRTYLKVIADGETVFDGRTLPGNAYQYTASQSIELMTGNAAAMQVVFNGQDQGVIGGFGEYVNLIFQGGGVASPTPRFTPTATGTPAPTLTLQPTQATVTPTVTPYIP
jgi:cytoskeleton protein RodZ